MGLIAPRPTSLAVFFSLPPMRTPKKKPKRRRATRDPLARVRAFSEMIARDVAYWRLKLRVTYPRAGEPWSLSEDRRLFRLVKTDLTISPSSPVLSAAASKLGRTPNALYARLQTLRVVRAYGGGPSPFDR